MGYGSLGRDRNILAGAQQPLSPGKRRRLLLHWTTKHILHIYCVSSPLRKGQRALNREESRTDTNRPLLCRCPSPPSSPSPASWRAGAARRFSPLPNSNPIHTQPRASGVLSCGCSSPAFSCHNIDTKQNNSDGETLPGSGRQTGEETGSSRLRYCAG